MCARSWHNCRVDLNFEVDIPPNVTGTRIKKALNGMESCLKACDRLLAAHTPKLPPARPPTAPRIPPSHVALDGVSTRARLQLPGADPA